MNKRITTAHQSITFSRRMMLLGGAQAAVGATSSSRANQAARADGRAPAFQAG